MAVTQSVIAQVDPDLAATYFREAAALCEREAGRLWGVTLCGPIVIADPATKTIAASQATPEVPRPASLGFANTAFEWGGTRWTALAWPLIPKDRPRRERMLLHELFHRVQPQLGLMTPDGVNDHLDTLDGRYWIQLEWRALAAALNSAGDARSSAVRDALAFRLTRHARFAGAAESERLEEIREGLAQYTGTVGSTTSWSAAASDAAEQLKEAPATQSFIRTFSYPSGAAYGTLLDVWQPGWTRQVKSSDDLANLLMTASGLRPTEDPKGAAARYDGAALRRVEEMRDAEQRARVALLRRRFVDNPVLILPGAPGSFQTAGVTPIPGIGTVYPAVRVIADWGNLEAATALRSTDRSHIIVPAPVSIDGIVLRGDGWTLQLAPGWVVRPGPRAGDFQVMREKH